MLDRIGTDALTVVQPIFSLSRFRVFVAGVAAVALAANLRAETGYDLWLRYVPVTDPIQRASYRRSTTAIVVPDGSPTSLAVASELRRGLRGLLGVDAPRVDRPRSDGAVVVGTLAS